MQYQKEDVRKRILQAGLDEFLTRGYHNGKISNIAKAAGVGVGNLYRYFKSKNSLMDAIVGDTYNSILKNVAHKLTPEYIADNAKNIDKKAFNESVAALADAFVCLLSRQKKEFLILLDNSEGSHYQDFKQKLYVIMNNYLSNVFFKTKTKEDDFFCFALGKAFFDMLFEILCKAERDSYQKLINSWIHCLYLSAAVFA